MIKSNAILEIKTKNLIKNYRLLANVSNQCITGATIKANAYGIGEKIAFKTLFKNGCRHFFLATLEEAISIRKINTKVNIYVLNGLENNHIDIFKRFKIIPILISLEDLKVFIKSKYYKTKIKIGVHVDTGLNRLGIKIDDLSMKYTKNIDLTILMSHLASADELNNSYNKIQNEKFKSTFKYFKSVKYKSLANTAGIFQNNNLHYDIVRPGIALYGGYNNFELKKLISLNPVIVLKAKVLQIKTINKNAYVGYNQTYKTKKKTKIAIIGIGYADGVSRFLSNKGSVYYKNEIFKIIGRISMDSTTIDISESKYEIKIGNYIEIINEKNDINKLAKKCSTISNEILTSISKRVKRVYI